MNSDVKDCFVRGQLAISILRSSSKTNIQSKIFTRLQSTVFPQFGIDATVKIKLVTFNLVIKISSIVVGR